MSHSNLAAILPGPGQPLKITTRPIPTPKDDEVLVRNFAVACNPSDHKIQQRGVFIKSWPAVVGQDVAGIAEAVGSNVRRVRPGDRVCGQAASVINSNPDHGAWQTYTILREMATTHIPDRIAFIDAAVVPAAAITAAMGLFVALGIPRQFQQKPGAILIWGASSAVGSAAVQIANAIGLTVYATASQQHHNWIRKLGAKKLFEHKDPDIISKILSAAREDSVSMNLAFDVIGARETLQRSIEIISHCGGKVATTVKWEADQVFPPNVELIMTITMQSNDIHADLGRWFFTDWLEKALENGNFKPAPKTRIINGGIAAAQEVFDLMVKGISGEKLVVEVQ